MVSGSGSIAAVTFRSQRRSVQRFVADSFHSFLSMGSLTNLWAQFVADQQTRVWPESSAANNSAQGAERSVNQTCAPRHVSFEHATGVPFDVEESFLRALLVCVCVPFFACHQLACLSDLPKSRWYPQWSLLQLERREKDRLTVGNMLRNFE